MFCGKCGTNIPEGSGFCPACGNAVGGAAPNSAPTPQPAAAPQPQQVVYARPLTKKEYLANHASDKAQRFSKLAIVLTFVYILVMIAGYFYTLEVSFQKIPIIRTAVGESEIREFEDMKKEANDWVEEVKEDIDENDDLTAKERRLANKLVKSMEKLTKTFSINGISRVVDNRAKIEDANVDIADSARDEIGDLQKTADQVFGIIKGALLFSVFFAAIFTIFGGFCKVKGLVITGLIFSLIHTFAFCGVIFVLAVIAVCAALIYVLSGINKEYRNFGRA